jgi:hypothetical protein
MKKLVALGVSALSAVALTIGPPVTVAGAEEPLNIDAVCEAIGGIDLGDLIGGADDQLTDADTAVDEAETAVDEAMTDYIAAAVATLEAVDAGDEDVAHLAADMQEKFDALVDAIVSWSEAKVAQFQAQSEVFSLGLKGDLLSRLADGLACGDD